MGLLGYLERVAGPNVPRAGEDPFLTIAHRREFRSWPTYLFPGIYFLGLLLALHPLAAPLLLWRLLGSDWLLFACCLADGTRLGLRWRRRQTVLEDLRLTQVEPQGMAALVLYPTLRLWCGVLLVTGVLEAVAVAWFLLFDRNFGDAPRVAIAIGGIVCLWAYLRFHLMTIRLGLTIGTERLLQWHRSPIPVPGLVGGVVAAGLLTVLGWVFVLIGVAIGILVHKFGVWLLTAPVLQAFEGQMAALGAAAILAIAVLGIAELKHVLATVLARRRQGEWSEFLFPNLRE